MYIADEMEGDLMPKFTHMTTLKYQTIGAWYKLKGSRLNQRNNFLQVMFLKSYRIELMLIVMGFLLGRALIFEQLSPFTLAFFAVIFFLKRDIWLIVGLASVCGNLLSVNPQLTCMISEFLIFYLIQKALMNYDRSTLSSTPFIVAIITFAAGLFINILSMDLTWISLFISVVEALLSFVLTLIFMQALPLCMQKRNFLVLRHDEMICLVLLLASVMSGTAGWMVGGISIEHTISRYVLLHFALWGGAPLGTMVGLVTGLILSLSDAKAIYQMSLLAFSGMVAGLCKDGKRIAVTLGLLVGSTLLSFYLGDQSNILYSSGESFIAGVLFMLTPQKFVQQISSFFTGTQDHARNQHDYAKRVKDVIAARVQHFSEVFRQLSISFKQLHHEVPNTSSEAQHNEQMLTIVNRACECCVMKKQCWEKRSEQTYQMMTDMMGEVQKHAFLTKHQVKNEWKQHCIRTDQVLDLMIQQYDGIKKDQQWQKQISESRLLVAQQLKGVSIVMDDLVKEIKREGQEMYLQEIQIRSALEDLGLFIRNIDIINLEEGNVHIEMIHPYTQGFDECRKIIAPLLSDILDEHIAVNHDQIIHNPRGYSLVRFGSAKAYEIDAGVATVARDGELLSGDSYYTAELGNGKFAVALSDGMGNGERARFESSTALTILEQLLQSGMDELTAIKSLNSILLLRSSEEMYATVDMALIDLYTAKTTFVKIGSTPSFIKRDQHVITISANNLPVGILQDIDVELVSIELKSGDIVIMMTDGIYDAPGHEVNKEIWMKQIIADIRTTSPQDFAECLLEKICQHHEDQINDDMTVVVAKVHKYHPQWATICRPWSKLVERPTIVS